LIDVVAADLGCAGGGNGSTAVVVRGVDAFNDQLGIALCTPLC